LEDALLAGLRDLGYVRGRNLTVDVRYAGSDLGAMPTLAAELVALKPDVLVGIESAAIVLRPITSRTPIVLAGSTDPVAAGLVHSLARPGTNVTGMAYRADQLIAKHIELLTEIVPNMSRIALLNYAALPGEPVAGVAARYEQFGKDAAAEKRLKLTVVGMRDLVGVSQAFARLEEEKAQGLVVVTTGLTFQYRREILGEARRLRLPSVSSMSSPWAEAGGLLTYGPDFLKTYRHAATFVDRILRGARPAEMSIEQPQNFEFLVNLRTGKEIGVAIPRSILLRADRVIQ
jgi:putative ABC transport system substrate-binding protein